MSSTRRKHKNALTIVVALALGAWIAFCLLLLLVAGEIYDYQDTFDGVRLPDVDVVVCLAGGRGRIAASGDLWLRYWERSQDKDLPRSARKLPTLFISGVASQTDWGIFSKLLRRGVREVISPNDVVLERESSNTLENAQFFARVAKERGWRRVLLVTSPYHMRRAQLLFQNVGVAQGLELTVDTASVFQEPFEPGEWRGSLQGVRVTLEEYLKWVFVRAWPARSRGHG